MFGTGAVVFAAEVQSVPKIKPNTVIASRANIDRAPIVFGSILRVFELEEAISTEIWEITPKRFRPAPETIWTE